MSRLAVALTSSTFAWRRLRGGDVDLARVGSKARSVDVDVIQAGRKARGREVARAIGGDRARLVLRDVAQGDGGARDRLAGRRDAAADRAGRIVLGRGGRRHDKAGGGTRTHESQRLQARGCAQERFPHFLLPKRRMISPARIAKGGHRASLTLRGLAFVRASVKIPEPQLLILCRECDGRATVELSKFHVSPRLTLR